MTTASAIFELGLSESGGAILVQSRWDDDETPMQSLGLERGRLLTFGATVAAGAKSGKRLHEMPPSFADDAQALYAAIFRGPVHEMFVKVLDRNRDSSVLLRLRLDPSLHAIPWEAACPPGKTSDFLGSVPELCTVRAGTGRASVESREILGAISMLVMAPDAEPADIERIRTALAERLSSGEVRLLTPLVGSASTSDLVARLDLLPHALHFAGHGGLANGHPLLGLAPDADGDARAMDISLLAQDLRSRLWRDLRLVVLEACEGARPAEMAGMPLGSAAQMLVEAGAHSVAACLAPIAAPAARTFSQEFYRVLVGKDGGHFGRALQHARRRTLHDDVSGLLLVGYLRGRNAQLFDFSRRKVAIPSIVPPGQPSGEGTDPRLAVLLKARFNLLLGDVGEDPRAASAGLRKLLIEDLVSMRNEDVEELRSLPVNTIAQRYELLNGRARLDECFQRAFRQKLSDATMKDPPIVDHLAKLLRPGVHATLLWLPHLEHALARHHPDADVWVVQPPAPTTEGERVPALWRRRAGAGTQWTSELSDEPPPTESYVVLRLYGGYTPQSEPTSLFWGRPWMTEDDHLRSLSESFLPLEWTSCLLGPLRTGMTNPSLIVGVSLLEWRHRVLLRWLFGNRPPPEGSLVLTEAGNLAREVGVWRHTGAVLPGARPIPVLPIPPDAFAAQASQEMDR